jgi:hypothetical protein
MQGQRSKPGEADCRELVERVLASAQFQKAARLREFLVYVCERALTAPQAEIHESEIAERVFGRGPGSSDDTIVRVHATQLRRRLEQYFSGPGACERLTIEIPKGNYAAVFRPRAVTEAAPAARASLKLKPVWALAAACLVLGAAVVALAVQNAGLREAAAGRRAPNTAAALFWSRLLDAAHTTDIVLADSSLSLFADITREPPTLADYADRSYWSRALRHAESSELGRVERLIAERRYTSLADASVLRSMGLGYGLENGRTNLVGARDFQARNLRTNHVILVGSRRSNPWVQLFEERLNFRSVYEESLGGYFENRHRKAGEPATYRPAPRTSPVPDSYCQIALVPNTGGTGNVLLIGGTEMEATEAGVDFLSREGALAELRRVLKLGPGEPYPYFDLLLRTARLGGAAPQARIEAHRVLEASAK